MATQRSLVAEYERRARALADDLAEGRITPDEWHERMVILVQGLHVGAYLQGRQVDNLDDEMKAIVLALLIPQLGFLANWLRQLLSSKALPTAKALGARAMLYAGAANATFQRASTDRMGLPPLPVYPGQRSTCRVQCRCHWRIRNAGDGNAECWWVLGVSEHCRQCRQRAAVFNPLRIVGGVIQPYIDVGLYV